MAADNGCSSVDLLCRSISLSASKGKILLLVEESEDYAEFLPLVKQERCTVVCSRFDAVKYFSAFSTRVRFNRMLLKEFAPGTFDAVFYRVSKSKPCTHYIINRCNQLLKPGQALHLAGGRTEGVKTYAEKAAALFGDAKPKVKLAPDQSGNRVVRIVKQSGEPATPFLPDSDYARMQLVKWCEVEFSTLPGVFGWNKIDRGSELLMSVVPQLDGLRVLDLGCGYGFLSVLAAQRGAIEVVATDNDARALAACRENFSRFAVPGRVVAADCGDALEEEFDCILCNPPFHQGFQSSHHISDKFVESISRLLAPGGFCYMVTNAFLGYEARVASLFAEATNLHESDGFKILRLRK